MTKDKSLVKTDQSLQLFSSRRQPPLLVSFYSQMLLLNDLELIFLYSTMFDVFLCQNSIGLCQIFCPQHRFEVKEAFSDEALIHQNCFSLVCSYFHWIEQQMSDWSWLKILLTNFTIHLYFMTILTFIAQTNQK